MAGPKTNNKKNFSKVRTQINNENIKQPKGLAPITMNLETFVSEYSDGMANAIGKFFVGADNTNNISELKGKLNNAIGSILGANSIYSILHDIYEYTNDHASGIPVYIKGINIKDNDIKSFFEDTINQQTETTQDNTIIDYTRILSEILSQSNKINQSISNLSKYYQESNKAIETILREFTNKMTTENGKITLMIRGLDPNSIDKLIEFASSNLYFGAINISNFRNFIEEVNKIKINDVNNAADNLVNISDVVSRFMMIGKKLELISYIFGDKSHERIQKHIGPILGSINHLFNIINNRIISIDKSQADKILESIDFTGKILRTYSSLLIESLILSKVNNKLDKDFYLEIGNQLDEMNKRFNGITLISKENRAELIDSLNTIGLIVSNLKSIDWKFIKSMNLDNLSENLKNIISSITDLNLSGSSDEKVKKLNYINQSIDEIQQIIDLLNDIKFNNSLLDKTKDINALIFGSDDKDTSSLIEILKKFSKQYVKTNNIEAAIKDVASFSELLIHLNEIAKYNFDKNKLYNNIVDYTETLLEAYQQIEERFKDINDIDDTIKKITETNKNLRNAFDDCDELITTTSKRKDKLDMAMNVMENMTLFMISAAAVMAIGALFTLIGGGKFLRAALEFGATLMVFEALVILPIAVMSGAISTASKSISGISSIIVQSTIVMTIGALFMMLGGGKFVENAIKFGVTLMVFETLIVAPFIMFGMVKSKANQSLTDFNKFIVTSTLLLMVGALFMALGGGKIAAAALMFGVLLAEFEALIILPFILFAAVRSSVENTMSAFMNFLITSTTVMMIGALFMGLSNGALARNALEFGYTLMKFEALIVAPFLIFNLIRRGVEQSAIALNSIIITSTTIMMIGALFMALSGGKFVDNAMKFAGILMAFEAMVIAPFLLFNFVRAGVLRGLRSFTEVMIASTFCMTIGAVFVNSGFLERAMKFALGLGGFMVIMSVAMRAMSWIITDKTLADLKSFELFMLTSTAILLVGSLYIEHYGWKSTLIFAGLLVGFISAISFVTYLLAKTKAVTLIPQIVALGTFIALATGSMIIGAMFVNKYGWKSVIIYGAILLGFVGLMGLVMLGLGALSPLIAIGSVVATMLGFSLLMLTGSLLIINTIFNNDKDGVNLRRNINSLISILSDNESGLAALYTSLNEKASAYLGGTLAAIALGFSLMTLSASLFIVSIFAKNEKRIRTGIETLFNILGSTADGEETSATVYGVFSRLTAPWMMLKITGGAIFGTLLSASLIVISSSLALFNLIINKNKDLGNNILIFQTYITQLGDFMLEISKQSLKFLAGSAAIALFGVPLLSSVKLIADVMNRIAGGMTQMASLGDLSSQKTAIINQISAFLGIAKDIPDDNIKDLKKKFNKILPAIDPMTETISRIASTMQDIAMLKIPVSWDNKGRVTMYRHLESKDFDAAKINIKDIITNMFDGLSHAYDVVNGKDTDLFNKVIKMSTKIGSIISGIAQGIGDMAKLQVPISWNENGQPRSYRQLNAQDFTLAQTHIQDIITYMFNAINSIAEDPQYEDMLSTSWLGIGNSKASKIINKTNDMAQMISNLAHGIVDMSSLKVATGYDENGRPNGYINLNETHFTQAGENVSKIMIALFDSISDANIKITSISKFDKVIERMTSATSLISNVGEAIQHMALLQIATKWDPSTGKAIDYRELTPEEFKQAGDNVGNILNAFAKILIENKSTLNDKDLSSIINNIKPSTDLIANIATAIQQMSNNQIPDQWNAKGQAIHYKEISSDTYTRLANAVANIAIAIPKAIIDLKQNSEYNALFSDNTIYEIIQHLSGTSELISNIADSVVKISQAQIPVYKDGKIDHYEEIDFTKVSRDLSSVINDIMTATSNAIIDVYNKNSSLFTLNNGTDLSNAINAISNMTGIVSSIIDPVIKFSTSQIPVYKDGKIDHYEKINPADIISNIKTLFGIGNLNEGILTILFDVVKNAINYIKRDKSLETLPADIQKLLQYTKNISELVGTSSKTIVDFASLNIPTEYKDGKPSNYVKLSKDDITEADENITTLIQGLFNVITSLTYNSDIEQRIETIRLLVSNINSLISITISGFSPLLESKDNMNKILIYRGKHGNKITGLDIFDDVYSIINGLVIIANNSNLNAIRDNFKIEDLNLCVTNISALIAFIDTIISHQFLMAENNIDDIISNVSHQIDKYVSIKSSIDTMISRFIENDNKRYLKAIDNIKGFNNRIIDVYNNINELSNKLSSTTNINTEDTNTRVDLISTFINRMIDNANSFNTLMDIKPTQDIDNSMLSYMINGITRYNGVILRFDNNNAINLEHSLSSLNSIFNEDADDKSVRNFINKADSIDKYVSTINSIQISKFDTLRKLVHELNILSSKMGNLDNLTTAIGDKLYAVLENLVNSLNNSSEVISKAENIQETRHAKIKEAMNEIRSIMNQELIVKVSSDTTEQLDDNQQGINSSSFSRRISQNRGSLMNDRWTGSGVNQRFAIQQTQTNNEEDNKNTSRKSKIKNNE